MQQTDAFSLNHLRQRFAATKAATFAGEKRLHRAPSWRIWSWAFAAAALFVALWVWQQAPHPTGIAILGDAGNTQVVSIAADSGMSEITISAGLPLPPEGRSLELWVIPADGVPHSLGVIDGVIASTVKLSEKLRLFIAGDSILAISIEPAGGSPTGLPTGPLILSGRIVSASRN